MSQGSDPRDGAPNPALPPDDPPFASPAGELYPVLPDPQPGDRTPSGGSYDVPPVPPPAFGPPGQRVPGPPPPRRRRWWIYAIAILVVVAVALVVLWWLPSRGGASARPAEIKGPTTIAMDDVREGDCLEPMPPPGMVDTVTIVPCAQSHGAQIVASADVTAGKKYTSYPGEATLRANAGQGCDAAWQQALAQVGPVASGVRGGTTAILPSRASWDDGDRSAWCVVYGIGGTLAGSLLG